jgi:pSer/pThr/pTyr-binding forkhead associated (FHA) protein
MDTRVFFIDASGRRHAWTLEQDQHRYTLGRATQADICLAADAEVSRLHAAVEWIGTAWTIVDDGLSRNGTYVNGQRLAGRRRLHRGDKIRIGTTVLTFDELSAGGDDTTRLATPATRPKALTETQRAVLIALCRPYKHDAAFANPATNQQIADEMFLSVDAVKTHLRTLFAKFDVEDLPHNQKRVRLAERALQSGIIGARDL